MNWELPVNWELSARSRTRLARAAYRVGGWLVHVKTYQREYAYEFDEDAGHARFPVVGRSWQSIGWAWDLLERSEVLDPEHWEHWAVDHSAPTLDGSICPRCPECGGGLCGEARPGGPWGHASPVTPDPVTGDGCICTSDMSEEDCIEARCPACDPDPFDWPCRAKLRVTRSMP